MSSRNKNDSNPKTKMIIGFGSTEVAREAEIEHAFRSFVESEYASCDASYFNDEFVEKVKEYADGQSKTAIALSDKYKTASEYPDRYTYFWVNVLCDCSNIVFIFKFHHVNRRHALSPDGWALMTNEKLVHVYELDIEKKKAA